MTSPDPVPAADARPRRYTGWARDGWLFGEGGVGILMYHKVSPPLRGTRWPSLYVRPEVLGQQVDELLAAGLPCIPYDRALAAIRSGERGFSLTFDDGFASVHDEAMPVLAARGVTAILFLVADLIGGSDTWDHAIGEGPHALMDEAQIRAWLAAGHEIGSHTLTHPDLTQISHARARTEITDSKTRLEDRFGKPVRHFCYPYGRFDERVRDLVEAAGYADAPGVDAGEGSGVNPVDVNPFRLRRIHASDPEEASLAHG